MIFMDATNMCSASLRRQLLRAGAVNSARSSAGVHGERSRSIPALTSDGGRVPLARPALLNKPPGGVARWAPGVAPTAGTAPQAAAGPRSASRPPPPAMADMPDLSHLTPEERAIIEGVMMRQRQEEQREHEIMRCAPPAPSSPKGYAVVPISSVSSIALTVRLHRSRHRKQNR
ncbi:Regulating synaptic membrane exocytosis protein 2 [Eumeta japonica]|uniref:Regulating synaptic membrane exocytosis protein 2 n=1 Tax=Eumeta variegata TaxID=151549 RepID=A0A4C1YBD8_EUMVA|nr:Regulating synaptic membrane exocytosis protein 2 [Eumeta japonica]